MNELEAYFLLLTDSIFGNLVLYPHIEFVLFTMSELGIYNSYITLLISLLGFGISVSLNYFFGKILYKIYKAMSDDSTYHNYKVLLMYFTKYGYIILLFNIFPTFGLFVPLLAGFVGFGMSRSIIFCSISKSIYYAYYLFL